jgi:outer membrane receptor protein involved in Fe transport
LQKARACLVAGVAVAALSAGAASAQTVNLSLPEQPLADSLLELSRRTGENILFQPDSMAGIRAQALNGRMTPEQAVQLLIQGTGLRAISDGRGGIIIQRQVGPEQTPPSTQPATEPTQIASAPAKEAAAPQSQVEVIEEIVVSASRIAIAGYSQPTPITIISAAQLERDAYPSISDSLHNLPQQQAPPAYASTNADQGSQGTGGTNFANLRNLGTTRTLVLFDSQRMVSATAATNVDLTTLPASVVSRVDVVTGGASAAWGSDAVAGVVNFVINKNIVGLRGTISGGDTANGRVRDFFAEATWGGDIFGGRGHIEFAANMHHRPDYELLTEENWYKGAYWVSNPAYTAGSGLPQLIVATNVAEASALPGGIINSSPAGVAGPGVVPAAANALRGIEFVGAGIPQLVNYGNLTLGTLSNSGSLTDRDSQASFDMITQPITTYTFFGYGRYRLAGTIQASLQLNYGYATNKGINVSTVQTALVVQSDNAFMPASVQAAMRAGGISYFTLGTLNTNNYDTLAATGANFSSMEGALAPAVYFTHRNVWRGVFTLDGTIGPSWSWTAYLLHAATRLVTHDLSIPIVANLTAAEDAVTVTAANRGTSGLPLGSTACRSTLTGASVSVGNFTAQSGCIPLDVFGTGVASPGALAYVTGASNKALDYLHQSLQLDVAEASSQGTLPWGLPAGKIAAVFGAGYRRQQGVVSTNQIAAVLGYGQGNSAIIPPSQYNVLEGFVEIGMPVLRNSVVNALDISMAGRMTSYSTSGLVETWKLGATSQINDDIRLRTTWSVDIRAPQIAELFSTGVSGSTLQRDPKTQANLFVLNQSPGNPDLKPEVAHTISGGLVLTPVFIPGFSMSADWYSIHLAEVIVSLNPAIIVNQCNSQLASLINPGQNGNPSDPLCARLQFNGPNGALSFINTGVLNFARQTTSGLDLSANYVMDFWDGTLSWSALANLNDESTLTNPGTGVNDSAGSDAGNTSSGPKWRGTLAATYNAGPYSFTAMTRWFAAAKSYQDGNTGNQASTATANLYDSAHFEVPFTAYLDLRASYKWNDSISFFVAIDNTLNTPPPLVAPTAAMTIANAARFDGTNGTIYDEIGRNFRLGVRFNY